MQNEANVDPVAKPLISTHAPIAATDAVVTLAAAETKFHVLDWVAYSYSASPTGGALTVTIGGTTVFQVAITAAGPGMFDFSDAPIYTITKNQAMVITLASGGGAVVGKLNTRTR